MPPDAAASQIVKVYLQMLSLVSNFVIFNYNLVRSLLLVIYPNKQEAVGYKGLRDDTTCIVIDLQSPEKSSPPLPAPPKKQGINVFKSMLKKKSSEPSSAPEKEYSEPDVVEELVEEGSANLSERFVILSVASCLYEQLTVSTLVIGVMNNI